MTITYLKGDATEPLGEGHKIIAHVCNCQGGWGRGFVLAVSKKWPQPEKAYRTSLKPHNETLLGLTQFVKVSDDIMVANMIAQKGYGKGNLDRHKKSKVKSSEIPLQYDHLETCLEFVNKQADYEGSTIHMPKIGSGLAGGDWAQIEKIIEKIFVDKQVFVYEL